MSLAIIFGLLFYLLKNTIDRLGRRKVYTISVLLYALSWALRAMTDDSLDLLWLFLMLVMITFCTSFFRLAMNKRFYDVAKQTIEHPYLILKSYYSQITIATGFFIFGYVSLEVENSVALLQPVYWCASVLALTFLCYGANRYRRS